MALKLPSLPPASRRPAAPPPPPPRRHGMQADIVDYEPSGAPSRRARVLVLSPDLATQLLRGELRITNIPADAYVSAVAQLTPMGREVGLRLQSGRWPEIPRGTLLPRFVPVIERNPE